MPQELHVPQERSTKAKVDCITPKGFKKMNERTLIVVKPDGVRRSFIGRVISRFEDKGFRVVKLEMVTLSRPSAEQFYSPHSGKPFFNELVQFISSGPLVAVVLEGNKAVESVRKMIGQTRGAEADTGTIRGDYTLGTTENLIHASDSADSVSRESNVIFG